MRIGIAFDLKPTGPAPAGAPDDLHEEFDSPVTVRAVADVFRALGHTPVELGNGRPLIEALLKDPPDLVFNFAEGSGVSRSREARVPAVCEMLGIPYTGSDPLALAVALDKDMTRRVAESLGLTVPKGIVLSPPPGEYDGDCAEFLPVLEEAGLPLPVIAKPTCEGSSKGIRNRCLIRTAAEFGPTVVELWKNYQQPVLVEEFISGDEVTVGIIGNDPPEPLGIMRVLPKTPGDHFVYSLEVKRNWEESVEYEAPAELPPAVTRAVEADALAVFAGLGCRDVARADFRVRDGVPYFLEINPLPGLNPESGDIVFLAYRLGLTYPQLVGMILDAAIKRYGLV
ncbi:D-alanine--D-alanine ligase family protein [Gemmata sp.]|uniref:D-alanine--D-alanine ligase family protein n=1 Tax=Gemmata sp. TaxID=1914242 RepID=UPI003F708AB7